MVSLPLLDTIVAMNPGDENFHMASAARRRHGRWCHMSSLRAPSDTLASRSTTRWRSLSKLRCNLAGLVATAEPDGRRPASSSPAAKPPIAAIRLAVSLRSSPYDTVERRPAEVRQMTGQGRRRAEGRGSTAVELLGRGGWRHRYWKNAGHTPTGRRFHPCLVHQRKSVLRGLSGSTGREHDRGVELRSTVS